MLVSRIAMGLLLAAGLGFFAWTARRRWELMFAAAAGADRSDRMGERVRNVLYYMFGQARMFRYRAAGIAHAFIFGGFVVLGLRTIILAARGFTAGGLHDGFGYWLFDDNTTLGNAYLFLKDLVSILVIVGVSYFLFLRLVVKPRRIQLSAEGIFILCMILGLMFSDMTYEAARYVLESRQDGGHGVFHAVTPGASVWAMAALRPLPDGVVTALGHGGFWLHTIIVLAFLNFLPYGKHFHIITVLPNVLTSNTDRIGQIRSIPDIEGKLEREETLGVKTVENFHWKDVLDFYTCTECGRCSDMCPAFNTGKLLSPKHLTMALCDHMYDNQEFLINLPRKRPSAETPGEGQTDTPAADDSGSFSLKDNEKFQLVPNVIKPEVIWACTTCGACEQECPVMISYVDKIVAMRQNAVMEQGVFPDQLQNAFRGLESVGNPYSFDNSMRAEWAQGLPVPLRSEKPEAEYLFWVGCSPSFDDRARRIARATAQLFHAAGLDFAILGPQEMCNGDPARRAGNEFLFQTLAKQNVETLNSYSVRKIVTTCPHCFNMLAREYPEFGGRYEVVHHTDLLFELLRAGRIKPTHRIDAAVAYHDSCYLGRYHGIYDPPRELLKAIPGVELREPKESRSRGMCCGAGGAQMWKEEEPIERPGSREGDGKVNHARVRQILKVLPSGGGKAAKVASGCPFCKTMLSDGLTDQGHSEIEQKDVAEYLWMSVSGEGVAGGA
jgi:Fe-S oxidoreductase